MQLVVAGDASMGYIIKGAFCWLKTSRAASICMRLMSWMSYFAYKNSTCTLSVLIAFASYMDRTHVEDQDNHWELPRVANLHGTMLLNIGRHNFLRYLDSNEVLRRAYSVR